LSYLNGTRNLDFIKRQMQSKKQVLFILPTLCAGGAERVISFIAKELNSTIFDVKLIVIGYKKDSVYDVESLKVQYLNKSRLLISVITLLRVIIKEKPSIVVSSIGHVNIMMGFFSLFFRKTKFVGREASIVTKMNEFSKLNSKLYLILMKLFYPRLSAIICQSEDMRQDFITSLSINPDKLILINNPITSKVINVKNNKIDFKLNFITIGRLSEEKGHSRILEALSKINSYDFIYTIIGSGPLELDIKGKIKYHGLSEKVNLIPYTSRVEEELIKNNFFLQGSFVEGFPNALLESCSVGTPVIAFNAPGGTKEIVTNGLNGFLVETQEEFVSILNNIDLLKSIDVSLVSESVINKFNSKIILKKYEMFFSNI
jgi:glycosyltransferase involved in cell wall biosynthesis